MEAWREKIAEGVSIDANIDLFLRSGEETGATPAAKAQERAACLVDAVTAKIRETPAKTFAGLAIKAGALQYDMGLSTQCDLPEEDQDWQERVMNYFVAEMERLAATAAV
jgi:hypothetical protein